MSLKFEIFRGVDSLYYLRHGQNHRENGPAELWADSDFWYYQYGMCHRDNGPSCYTLLYNNSYYHRGIPYVPEI